MKVSAAQIGLYVCSVALVIPGTTARLDAQAPGWEQAIAAGERALAERDFERAETQFQSALKQAEALGSDNLQTAETLMRMSRLYRAQGDYAKPELLYKECLRVARRALGPEHPDYAAYLNEVGRYYHARRKYGRSEDYYVKAFAIRVEKFGREHPLVAESISNLAVLYENLGQLPRAEVYHEHALQIREKALGRDHLDTITTLEHFSRLLQKMQRSVEARMMEDRARAVREKRVLALDSSSGDLGEVYSGREVRKPPRLADKTEPEYTDEARIARQEGVVILQVAIAADGRARNFRLLRSLGLGLDEKAVEAVRQWTFNPARKDGKKVTVVANIEINFRLL